MKIKTRWLTIGIIMLALAGYALFRSKIIPSIPRIAVEGEELARMHCGSCHQFPDPELLDKETWEHRVLPDMGRRLGIQSLPFDPLDRISAAEVDIVQQLGIYPDSPLLSEKEWVSIVDYYIAYAPEYLQQSNIMHIESESSAPFQAHRITTAKEGIPRVTLLYFDTIRHDLYIGAEDTLYTLNINGEFTGKRPLPGRAVDFQITPEGNETVLTNESTISTVVPQGSLLISEADSSAKFHLVLDSLLGPVHFSIADLDGDDRDDVIISEHGHHRGSLTWYANYAYTDSHELLDLPGARETVIRDMNQDGLPDIVALRAHSQEGVDIYYNRGRGRFTRETVLEFSPVHGVSSLQLADFNADGHADLLIANGHNGDFSQVKKPYHGIRIYLNDGANQFEESMFYPMNGCTRAIVRDFDGDGDLDIAAIAFYDHEEDPEKGFLFLENNGNEMFVGHYLPEAAKGRWLVLEAGDFDQDGYDDIFLGSYFRDAEEMSDWAARGTDSFPEVLFLSNTTMLVE